VFPRNKNSFAAACIQTTFAENFETMNKRVVLMVLDGWGIAKDKSVSAIDKAHTPFIDSLYQNYPHSKLSTSGLDVGLPDGQMGNSEVGHMNLGAGRVVYQDLVRIHKAIEDKSIHINPTWVNALRYAKQNNKPLHLFGLVSDGGVHSHINHLIALCHSAHNFGVNTIKIHAFTDGRDCDPNSGLKHIKNLEEGIKDTGARIVSVIGRYYAMDRDQRWERIKKAYDLMVHGKGEVFKTVEEAIRASYANGITDEFIEPCAIGNQNHSIQEGDVTMCFNFRTDRGRQITRVLTQEAFSDYGMQPIDLYYLTLTRYDKTFKNVHVLFEKDNLNNTLGEVLAKNGKKQIRIAETEKYPHVTFFFSGGREAEFEGEKRILINSPKVATYDQKPEMSAREITDAIVFELEKQECDFVVLNFANPDMVGHTGVFEAAIKACETVDQCTQQVVESGMKNKYTFIILADHGNSDCMINPDGSPNTAHTTNPVPCFLVDASEKIAIKDGKLGDIAPTICKLMGITVPNEMSGHILV